MASTYQIRRRRLLAAALCLLLGAAPRPGVAQGGYPPGLGSAAVHGDAGALGEDPFQMIVGGAVTHDSNLFRVADELRESDTVAAASVGLRLDKRYSLQRLQLDAAAIAYRYDRFSHLDFDAFNYRGAWLWQLTPSVGGSLSASRTQTPTQFRDQQVVLRNVRTTERLAFDLDAWLAGGWHAVFRFARFSDEGEIPAFQSQPNYRQNSFETGARYVFRSGSELAVLWRGIKGDEDEFAVPAGTNDYSEDDAELQATWLIDAKSTLIGRLAYLDRRYGLAPLRDFSGVAGTIGYQWQVTSKLSLNASAAREIEPWRSLAATSRTRNVFALVPAWQVTPKLSLSAGLRRAYDDYPSALAGIPDREDTLDHAALAAQWSPLRRLTISATVYREKRSSNDPAVEYSTRVGTLAAQLSFF